MRLSAPAAALLFLLPLLCVRANAPVTMLECAPNSFPSSASTCAVCAVSTLSTAPSSILSGSASTTTCFDSFEQNSIGASGYAYAPSWNGWTISPLCGGISGDLGPWQPPSANAYMGIYMAFLQKTCAGWSRTLSNLLPNVLVHVSFFYAFRGATGAAPVPSPLTVTFNGAPFIAFNITLTESGGWLPATGNFTPTASSGTIAFAWLDVNQTDHSFVFDALAVTQQCSPGFFPEQAAGACLPCAATTMLSRGGCYESFEASSASMAAWSSPPGGIWAYSPPYPGWLFSSGFSGIAFTGAPWDTIPSSTAGGQAYAFIQNSGHTLSTLVTNLVPGAFATLQFWYSFRWNGGAISPTSPLNAYFGSTQVYSTTDWLSTWTPVSVSFPVSASSGNLSFALIVASGGDFSMLIDGVSISPTCGPGTAPNPTVATCTQCAAGTSSPGGIGAKCTLCSPGYFAGTAGSLTCQPCGSGFAALTPGATACTACSTGVVSMSGAATCGATCSAGYYASGSSCVACPANTFSATAVATSAAACVACAPLTFAAVGSSSCSLSITGCPAGTFMWPGTTSCLPCSSSTMSALANSPNQGMTTATSCVESFEAVELAAPASWAYLPYSSALTSAGTTGYYAVPWNNWLWNAGGLANLGSPWDASPSSVPFGGGSFYAFLQVNPGGTIALNPATLSRTLVNLDGGAALVSFYYSTRSGYAPGASAVLTCTLAGVTVFTTSAFPSGWTAVGPVAVTIPARSINSNEALLQFQLSQASTDGDLLIDLVTVNSFCALGSYPSPSPAQCVVCPGGQTQSVYGGKSCTLCPPGTFSNSTLNAAAAPNCTLCPAGYFAALPGSSSCTPCAANSISTLGATSCSPCAYPVGPAAAMCTASPSPSHTMTATPSATLSPSPTPAPLSCFNGLRDSGESGIDCGGSTPCARCAAGQQCTNQTDCSAPAVCAAPAGVCTDSRLTSLYWQTAFFSSSQQLYFAFKVDAKVDGVGASLDGLSVLSLGLRSVAAVSLLRNFTSGRASLAGEAVVTRLSEGAYNSLLSVSLNITLVAAAVSPSAPPGWQANVTADVAGNASTLAPAVIASELLTALLTMQAGVVPIGGSLPNTPLIPLSVNQRAGLAAWVTALRTLYAFNVGQATAIPALTIVTVETAAANAASAAAAASSGSGGSSMSSVGGIIGGIICGCALLLLVYAATRRPEPSMRRGSSTRKQWGIGEESSQNEEPVPVNPIHSARESSGRGRDTGSSARSLGLDEGGGRKAAAARAAFEPSAADSARRKRADDQAAATHAPIRRESSRRMSKAEMPDTWMSCHDTRKKLTWFVNRKSGETVWVLPDGAVVDGAMES